MTPLAELPVVEDTVQLPERMAFDIITCPAIFSFSFQLFLSQLTLDTTSDDDVVFAVELLVSGVLLAYSWLVHGTESPRNVL